MRDDGERGLGPLVWVMIFGGVFTVLLGGLTLIGGGLSLPALFTALAAVMLLLSMAALWQSLRGVFGGGPEAFASTGALPERSALLDEKETLLRAIKDIGFEREVGKISDEDFRRLDRAYRQRAKEVLRALDDDLAPYLQRAETLIDEAVVRPVRTPKKKRSAPVSIDCPACGTDNDLDAIHCKACGARIEELECVACGTANDPDAKFCKQCATPLAPKKSSAAAKKKKRSKSKAKGRAVRVRADDRTDVDSASASDAEMEADAESKAESEAETEADANAEVDSDPGSEREASSSSELEAEGDSEGDGEDEDDAATDARSEAGR